MRVGNSTTRALARARVLRQAKIKARSKSSSNTSSKKSNNATASSLLNKINNSKNGTNNSTNTTQVKSNYTAMKTAANGVQEHLNKLLATGEDSLFGKAIPDKESKTNSTKASNTTTDSDETEASAEELAKYKENVEKEINNFIDDYNTMVSKMSSIGGTINNIYLKQIKTYVSDNKTALKNLGITQASDGTLRVNQKTLKAADVTKMQKVFGAKNSFADKVAARSKNVESNANTNLTALNKSSSSSNYNRYGSSNSSYGGSGYNAKG